MFSFTITVDTPEKVEAVVAFIKTLEGDAPKAAKPVPTKGADKTPAKTETKKAEDKKPAGPTEAEKEALYAPVKAKALELNKAKGRDVLLRVLSAFDAATAPELKIEQYDAFIEAADEELIA